MRLSRIKQNILSKKYEEDDEDEEEEEEREEEEEERERRCQMWKVNERSHFFRGVLEAYFQLYNLFMK